MPRAVTSNKLGRHALSSRDEQGDRVARSRTVVPRGRRLTDDTCVAAMSGDVEEADLQPVLARLAAARPSGASPVNVRHGEVLRDPARTVIVTALPYAVGVASRRSDRDDETTPDLIGERASGRRGRSSRG